MTTAKTDTDVKDKAAGKHIPEPPVADVPVTGADAEAAPGADETGFTFEPAGADTTSAPAIDHVESADAEGAEDEIGATWIDEQVALGRRIAVRTEGDGSSITYEEIVPSNATNTQVAAAKERLRKRLVAA